jgi:hypothetical protein
MIGKDSAGNIGLPAVSAWSVGSGSAAALCAVALVCAWAMPATADPVPSIRVATASVPMTAGSATATTVVAACPSGTRLVGGGMWTGKADPADPAVPINGLRAKGSYPSDSGGAPLTGGAADPGFWSATGNFGGQSETGDQVTSFALCASKKNNHRVIAVASVQGPTTAQTTATATATCPAGTTIVGGGALGTPTDAPSFKPVGSFPSDANGTMLPDGALNPTSWTAIGSTGGNADPAAVTTTFAVCARPQGVGTRVTRVDGVGPQTGSTFTTISASCPGSTTLLGGGVNVDTSAGPLQGGVHLRGSYPSDAAGSPVADGAVNPTTWSGIVAAGGQPAPNTTAHAFAICADHDVDE